MEDSRKNQKKRKNNMMNELIGGVSPLKRRTSRTKAGSIASSKKGTHTKAQDRSGFSRSGAEGVNMAGFTPNTRVTSSMVDNMPSPSIKGKSNKGGKTIIGTDASGAPVYNYYGDVDNSTHIDQDINVSGGSGKVSTSRTRKSYKQAWIDKGGDPNDTTGYNQFVIDSEKWWKKKADAANMSVSDYKKQYFSGSSSSSSGGDGNVNVKADIIVDSKNVQSNQRNRQKNK